MKTTVVVPNYNGIQYLSNCISTLQSARSQCDFEIIIVDNGSEDGSLELAKQYLEEKTARLIAFPENTGFCGAVNAGIRQAKTEYVILLNNDTEVTKDFVKNLERFMDEHPNAFSASSKMLSLKRPELLDDCGDLYCALGWAYALGKGKPRSYYEKDAVIFAACGGAAIYRRKIFEEIGLFDENHFAYLEDIDIGYRAAIYGYRNYYCHDAVVFHAGSAVSGSRYNRFKIDLSAKNSIYLIYKNMPFLQALLNLPFFLAGFLLKILFFTKRGFGGVYVRGLIKGFSLCASSAGREQKVAFRLKNLPNYCCIQLQLWWNTIRRLLG